MLKPASVYRVITCGLLGFAILRCSVCLACIPAHASSFVLLRAACMWQACAACAATQALCMYIFRGLCTHMHQVPISFVAIHVHFARTHTHMLLSGVCQVLEPSESNIRQCISAAGGPCHRLSVLKPSW